MKKKVSRFSTSWTLGQAAVSAAIDAQHVVCHKYRRGEGATVLIRVTDGHEIWRYPCSAPVGCHTGTVAVSVGRELHLLDASTGALLDVMDFPDARIALPLQESVLALGSSGVLAARDRATGRKLWSQHFELSPGVRALAEWDGIVLVAGVETVFGVDGTTGERRWEYPHYVYGFDVTKGVLIASSPSWIHALLPRDGTVLWSSNIEAFVCSEDLVHTIGSDQEGAQYLTRSVRDGGLVTSLPISTPKRFDRGSGKGVAAVWGDLVLVVTRTRLGGFMIDRRSAEFAGEVAFGSSINRAVVCGRHLLLFGHGVPLMCLSMRE